VPVLPAHTVYFQVLFQDSDGATLAAVPGIAAELSAATVGTGVAVHPN
jgi:hypothetical protein